MGRPAVPAHRLRGKIQHQEERQYTDFIAKAAKARGQTAGALREKIIKDWCKRNGMTAQ